MRENNNKAATAAAGTWPGSERLLTHLRQKNRRDSRGSLRGPAEHRRQSLHCRARRTWALGSANAAAAAARGAAQAVAMSARPGLGSACNWRSGAGERAARLCMPIGAAPSPGRRPPPSPRPCAFFRLPRAAPPALASCRRPGGAAPPRYLPGARRTAAAAAARSRQRPAAPAAPVAAAPASLRSDSAAGAGSGHQRTGWRRRASRSRGSPQLAAAAVCPARALGVRLCLANSSPGRRPETGVSLALLARRAPRVLPPCRRALRRPPSRRLPPGRCHRARAARERRPAPRRARVAARPARPGEPGPAVPRRPSSQGNTC